MYTNRILWVWVGILITSYELLAIIILDADVSMQKGPEACTTKHYGIMMYGFCGKLVCFESDLKQQNNTSLLFNLSIFRAL